MLEREGLNIPISEPSFRQNWYSRRLTEKMLQMIFKFARQYRISHCKSPSIELFVLDIYYVFISIVQKFAPLLHLTLCIIHHISLPCRSRAHRGEGLKGNPSLAFGITIKKKVTFTGKSITFGARLINLNQDLSFMDTRTKTKV